MMYWGSYDGWTWLFMAAMMVLFWGGVAGLIVYVARTMTGPMGPQSPGSGDDRSPDDMSG